MPGLIYLAAPYSSDVKDPVLKKAHVNARMNQICCVISRLLTQRIHVFTPLMNHFTIEYSNVPPDREFWQDYSYAGIDACEKVFVLTITGWHVSTGVRAEIAYANSKGIPVEYIDEMGEQIPRDVALNAIVNVIQQV